MVIVLISTSTHIILNLTSLHPHLTSLQLTSTHFNSFQLTSTHLTSTHLKTRLPGFFISPSSAMEQSETKAEKVLGEHRK